MEAFAQYQHKQAWVWEHQALTRARFVTGNQHVAYIFEQTRKGILCQTRNLLELKQDILMMREKMLDAHPNSTTLFDIKHDRGGIIDVEFMVQCLVLGHACNHPQLTGNIGNIALLKLAAELGLINRDTAKKVHMVYREFRRTQHRLRLNSETDLTSTPSVEDPVQQQYARVKANDLNDARIAVLQLWQEVFGN